MRTTIKADVVGPTEASGASAEWDTCIRAAMFILLAALFLGAALFGPNLGMTSGVTELMVAAALAAGVAVGFVLMFGE